MDPVELLQQFRMQIVYQRDMEEEKHLSIDASATLSDLLEYTIQQAKIQTLESIQISLGATISTYESGPSVTRHR